VDITAGGSQAPLADSQYEPILSIVKRAGR